MTDGLRLRTARALRWTMADSTEVAEGVLCQLWARPGRKQPAYITTYPDGPIESTTMPHYGTTWASCDEVDAEIRRREWEWEALREKQAAEATLWGGAGLGDQYLSRAKATTFPEALCLAFCQAAERSGE